MSSTKRSARCSLDDSLTNIQWLCSLDSNLLHEAEKRADTLSDPGHLNPYPRPPFSYATLILLAINSTFEKRMTLQDIYRWIEDNFPYFKHCKKAWKNSIRHNLSLHSFFLKAKRPSNLPGKGSYWSISPEGKENIMKEVMKQQQPHFQQNLLFEPSTAKGLRPILPKPPDNVPLASPFLNNTVTSGVEHMTDGSINGLPYSIPVVVLPAQMYSNIANKIAAQAAAGNMDAVGVNPTFFPLATDSSSLESTTADQQGSREHGQTADCDLLGRDIKEEHAESSISLAQLVSDIILKKPLNETLEPVSDHSKNSEGKVDSRNCSSNVTVPSNCRLDCDNPRLKDEEEGYKLEAPCAKKTRKHQKKVKLMNKKTSTPKILQKKQNLPCPKRSPLQPRPQPTLAAINSEPNELITSPGGVLNKNVASDSTGFSPIKPMITPTKNCSNQSFLSSLFVSPLSTSNLTCSGLTPSNYGLNSGFFTPLRQGEMDFAFLFSPERFASQKKCSTPQGCRKSLRLGLMSKPENKNLYSSYSVDDADFSQF